MCNNTNKTSSKKFVIYIASSTVNRQNKGSYIMRDAETNEYRLTKDESKAYQFNSLNKAKNFIKTYEKFNKAEVYEVENNGYYVIPPFFLRNFVKVEYLIEKEARTEIQIYSIDSENKKNFIGKIQTNIKAIPINVDVNNTVDIIDSDFLEKQNKQNNNNFIEKCKNCNQYGNCPILFLKLIKNGLNPFDYGFEVQSDFDE